MVSYYPTIQLMGRSPLPKQMTPRPPFHPPKGALSRISRRFQRLSRSSGQISYVLRTRPPLSTPRKGLPVRLACVRHAANVHPEPGSNSPFVSHRSCTCTSPAPRHQGPPAGRTGLLSFPLSCCQSAPGPCRPAHALLPREPLPYHFPPSPVKSTGPNAATSGETRCMSHCHDMAWCGSWTPGRRLAVRHQATDRSDYRLLARAVVHSPLRPRRARSARTRADRMPSSSEMPRPRDNLVSRSTAESAKSRTPRSARSANPTRGCMMTSLAS